MENQIYTGNWPPRNVNASLRSIIENYEPLSYTGIDIIDGEGVDIVSDANELLNQF